jgi:hypothetical protein
METNYKAMDLAYQYGKTVILNPAPSAKIDTEYLKRVTYFIPNEHEAKDFTGITITDTDSARKAAIKLLEMGCKNVLITMGDKGAFFKNENEEMAHWRNFTDDLMRPQLPSSIRFQADLDKLKTTAYSEFIIGTRSFENWDAFVRDYMDKGGAILEKEAQEYYDKYIKK